MTHSMLRRQLKNLVQNFSEAEVKVREATSNDPWGPSSSQMSDISDLSYNVVACNEIMAMLLKRLNDDKNWRHVYKSLTLLECLLKTGSDRIPKQCQESIHVIKALIEYRFTDKDGKDQGVNVREKAKIVMTLIEDEDKRKEEREFAMKTKDKLAKAPTASSDTVPEKDKAVIPPYTGLPSLDNIPSVADLTACMAAKKEEQRRLEAQRREEERRAKEGDTEPDLWEQGSTAAAPSKADPWGASSDAPKDSGPPTNDPWGAPSDAQKDSSPPSSDPWGGPADDSKDSAPPSNDPWGGSADAPGDSTPVSNDPWGGSADAPGESTSVSNDPWGGSADAPGGSAPASSDPWGGSADSPKVSAPATSDPWGAPSEAPVDSAPAKSDPWGTPAAKAEDAAPATSDPWETPAEEPTAKSDPWGGEGAASATSPSDPFGDGAKADNDPWGSSAASPPGSNDPWGAPAAPSDATATDDPFGDGGKAGSDPWGAESATNGTGDADDSKKPGFLGDAASLVDLDSLLSSKPKPKQPPLNAIPTSSQKAPTPQGPAQVMTLSPGCTISNRGGSIPFPCTSNTFGFTPMTSTTFGSLGTHNTPFPNMAPISYAPPISGLALPAMGFPTAPPHMNSEMVWPSTARFPIGGISATPPMGAGAGPPRQPAPWGPGPSQTGGGGNNPFLF